MILARAPLRIGFVGGGTDLPDFYRKTPGRVISTAIDKYVYIVVNRTPLVPKVSARYSVSETVNHPDELQHTRIKAMLKDMGILNNIEIASFAHLPGKTGLGSSSSFTVALAKALHAFDGKSINKGDIAEYASHVEINLVGEPIGKQDQYAAAFGGFNVLQFNPDESVDVETLNLGFKTRLAFEDHMIIFYTGITRSASSVLTEQKANISKQDKFTSMKKMADLVPEFRDRLLAGDFRGMGGMLHENWLLKRSLASNVTNPLIDELYNAGMNNGAWGGKVLGAGGGGCVMFFSPPEHKAKIRDAVHKIARRNSLNEFKELPISFAQSGVEVLLNADVEQNSLKYFK